MFHYKSVSVCYQIKINNVIEAFAKLSRSQAESNLKKILICLSKCIINLKKFLKTYPRLI